MKTPATHQHTEPKERALAVEASITKLLRWDEMHYKTFQYESGLNYLEEYLKDEYSERIVSRCSSFWKWWRNHWTQRDYVFMEFEANTTYDLETLREFYRDMHDAKTLAMAIYPNGVIMNESYAVMVTELVEQEKQKV